MKPFFSIVIPTYNRAALIAKAIESVIVQIYSNWELLIIDDGSKDNTKQVVEAYKDSRIRHIYQTNAERSAARNNGIKHSTGTYICFLDSDDYYLPARLQQLYNELEKRNFPVAAFYTGLMLDQNGALSKRKEEIKDRNIFNHLALSVIHSQQACIHHSILAEYKYNPQFHIGEDMELWLRIAEKYPFVLLSDQETIVVVDHEDRSVNVKKYDSYTHQLRMLKTVFSESHPGKNTSAEVKKQLLSNSYFGIAKYFIYNNNRLKAMQNLLSAIVADTSHFQNKYRLNLAFKLLLPGGIEKAKQLLQ